VFVYGLRVACATYAFAGLYFLLLAPNPSAHAVFVGLGAAGLLFAGAVSLTCGVALRLSARGYLVDVLFLWTCGGLLWVWRPRRREGCRDRRDG
jgi:hypothetical protein